MGRKHHPRRGSLQFWPHKRSKKHCARVRTWATVKENKLLGFLGYKVGMTHLLVKDNNPNSHLKDRDIFTPVTVIECPPMKVYSIRYYLENEDNDQEIVSEVFSKKVDKELKRKITASKKDNKAPEKFDRVTATVYSQVSKTGIGKKKPDLIEVGIGGNDLQVLSEYALTLLDKEIKILDIYFIFMNILWVIIC